MNHVRRSLWSYLSYVQLVALCLLKLFLLNTGWSYFWIFSGLVALIILGRLILKPYYFEIRGSKLVINRDWFYEEEVELNDIEKFELGADPFSKSYIKLKDYKMGLEFNYFIVNDVDFNRLKDALQVKAE